MNQQTLSFVDDPRTIQERFEDFDRAHPDVFLLKLARQVKATGRKRFGAKALIEQIRWHFVVSSAGEVPVLDNSFTSLYARKLAATFPEEFGDFFEFRQLRS